MDVVSRHPILRHGIDVVQSFRRRVSAATQAFIEAAPRESSPAPRSPAALPAVQEIPVSPAAKRSCAQARASDVPASKAASGPTAPVPTSSQMEALVKIRAGLFRKLSPANRTEALSESDPVAYVRRMVRKGLPVDDASVHYALDLCDAADVPWGDVGLSPDRLHGYLFPAPGEEGGSRDRRRSGAPSADTPLTHDWGAHRAAALAGT